MSPLLTGFQEHAANKSPLHVSGRPTDNQSRVKTIGPKNTKEHIKTEICEEKYKVRSEGFVARSVGGKGRGGEVV